MHRLPQPQVLRQYYLQSHFRHHPPNLKRPPRQKSPRQRPSGHEKLLCAGVRSSCCKKTTPKRTAVIACFSGLQAPPTSPTPLSMPAQSLSPAESPVGLPSLLSADSPVSLLPPPLLPWTSLTSPTQPGTMAEPPDREAPPRAPSGPLPPLPWTDAFSTDPDRILCRKCCKRSSFFRWYSHCYVYVSP